MLTNEQLEEESRNHAGTVNGFWFAGRHTSEFNMYVEKYPARKTAARKRTAIAVPGRNGDLHFVEDAFENYEQPYECYFHGPQPMPIVAHQISDWLHGDGSYRELSDSYDPETFRMATFVGPMDIANTLNKYGRCTVVFDCAPQSYLHSGLETVTFTQEGILTNPTLRTALPIITIRGTGSGKLIVGDITVEIKQMADQIVLDCDTQNAYRQLEDGTMENLNSCIYAPVFPALGPGDTTIRWIGDITSVEIIPRWWTL